MTLTTSPPTAGTRVSRGWFVVPGMRYYKPGLGRWENRDPLGERGGPALYGFCGNDSCGRIDPIGERSRCPPGTCDRWSFTLVHVVSAGAGTGAVSAKAHLAASRDCCMRGVYNRDTFYAGVLAGGGAKLTGSFSGATKDFRTKCIPWEEHDGFGTITSAGIAVYWSLGAVVWIKTPQMYETFHGGLNEGNGLDLSIFTAIGVWKMTPPSGPWP